MMNRISALALITYKEGIRNRSLFGILAFALFVLGLNITVAGFFMREVGKVTVDMNLSAMTFSGLLLVFFVALNLMSKDIDKKTIQLVFSKPISRAEYIVGKYLGIQMFILTSLFVLFVMSTGTVFFLKNIYPAYFGGFSWPAFFIATLFIFLKLSVLSAILVFFSTITTSSFACLIFTVCFYLIGETLEDVIFYIKSGVRTEHISEGLQSFIDVISYVFPNFSLFDFKLEAAHGLVLAPARLGFGFFYALLYIVILLSFACFLFHRREFH